MGETKKRNRASSDTEEMPITEQERKALSILRNLDYGEVRIVVKDSELVQIEEKKSIKL